MKGKMLYLAMGIILASSLTGCPIWWDDIEYIESCDGSCWWCDNDFGCRQGSYCNEITGYCVESSTCSDSADCWRGHVCDTVRNTCMPIDTCYRDEDCDEYAGYCDEESGICIPTFYCSDDSQCTMFGESFVCTDAGVCAPDEGPCPDGHCGCASDAECSNGWLCEGGLCRDPATLCVFNFECPAGTICLNSICRVDCSRGPCPSGQVCEAGLWCVDDPDGGRECLYASDCGDGKRCVNGYCTPTCTFDSECGNYKKCLGGICRVSIDLSAECRTTADCDSGLICLDHVCRMPCAADINCASMGEFSICGAGGVCRTPQEVRAECDRSSDCLTSRNCLNADCL